MLGDYYIADAWFVSAGLAGHPDVRIDLALAVAPGDDAAAVHRICHMLRDPTRYVAELAWPAAFTRTIYDQGVPTTTAADGPPAFFAGKAQAGRPSRTVAQVHVHASRLVTEVGCTLRFSADSAASLRWRIPAATASRREQFDERLSEPLGFGEMEIRRALHVAREFGVSRAQVDTRVVLIRGRALHRDVVTSVIEVVREPSDLFWHDAVRRAAYEEAIAGRPPIGVAQLARAAGLAPRLARRRRREIEHLFPDVLR
jgi:hypothetical protein